MRRDDYRGSISIVLTVVLVLLALSVGGVVYLRVSPDMRRYQNVTEETLVETPIPTVQPSEEPETTPEPEESPEPVATAEPETTPEPEQDTQEQGEETPSTPAPKTSPEPSQVLEFHPIIYDQTSYQLVTDMVFAYKKQVPNMQAIIDADVEALKAHDERLGEAWGGIMDFWSFANAEMEIHYDLLPEDLPGDDSLCIVVLGFELDPDGGMAEELLGRCELALAAAEQYPNAYLAVTGGGTALKNADVTEASVMADWFREHGVAEERLILEDRSLTTDQNAHYTMAILTNEYPQVRHLAIVSSDYHLPLGSLMFTAAAKIYGCEHGVDPFDVVAVLGYPDDGLPEYTEPEGQGLYLWALTKPGG